MPKCVCGKEITKLPKWLENVNVKFRCFNCPQTTAVQPPIAIAGFAEEEEIEAELINPEVEAEIVSLEEIEEPEEEAIE
ncbi:MAG TPA: hypothetical protein VNK96_07280 [Fimbriimonadales bacterium]|nr:hypothetical protein [Fimbriimonadales bacterium]